MRLTLSWRSANGKIITFVDATCGRRLSLTNSACLTDNQSCLVENKIRTKVHNAAPQRAPFEFGHGDLAWVNLAWVIWLGWPMQASVACMGNTNTRWPDSSLFLNPRRSPDDLRPRSGPNIISHALQRVDKERNIPRVAERRPNSRQKAANSRLSSFVLNYLLLPLWIQRI